MIFHVVLFRPRSDLPGDDREALASAFERAVKNIPGVRNVHAGRRITHGWAYESLMTEDMPYAILIEFDDLTNLQAYLRHPAHEELGTRFMASIAAAYIYDYDFKGVRPALTATGLADSSAG